MKILQFATLILAAASLAGCSTPQPRTLGDGTTQTFKYHGGVPQPVENDWAIMTVAGSAIDSKGGDPKNIPFTWQFAFKAKTDVIKKVAVYDVTEAPPRLVLEDSNIALKNGGWHGASQPVVLSKETVPWLYSPGDTENIFKIILTDAAGNQTQLYQPCLHSYAIKKMLVEYTAKTTAP